MKGILLVNTGSPKSANPKDVKSFLGTMLSDPMVMTVPDWFRPILVKGIILPLRQFVSARHYSLIWNKEENLSPLLFHTFQLAKKLELESNMPVEMAMRYGLPSIALALDNLSRKAEELGEKLNEVIVLPLFPHYAESSYGTTVKAVESSFRLKRYPFQLRFIEPYFNHSAYIKALVESIKPYLVDDFDKLIFNYHSLPLSHIEAAWVKGKEFDYVFQTKETTRRVMTELGIEHAKVRQVYSSCLGSNWLKPGLNETVRALGKEGNKRVIVVSPGFAVDNLETLYDVGIIAKNTFVKHGGKQLEIVSCLNSNDVWVKGIEKIIF